MRSAALQQSTTAPNLFVRKAIVSSMSSLISFMIIHLVNNDSPQRGSSQIFFR